jgi:hypothetical protein
MTFRRGVQVHKCPSPWADDLSSLPAKMSNAATGAEYGVCVSLW